MAPKQPEEFRGLPIQVVGPVDLGRLIRELEALDEALLQQRLKKQEPKLPKTSKLMDELLAMNHINLLIETESARLMQILEVIKEKAPVLHISFSADPSPEFTGKLMAWIRSNIHPLALVTVGLQPNIGAGCILRTNNKFFDFSLGARFNQNRAILLEKMREVTSELLPEAVQPVLQPAEAVA